MPTAAEVLYGPPPPPSPAPHPRPSSAPRSAAEALYGPASPAPAPAGTPKADSIAETLYGEPEAVYRPPIDLPDEVLALRHARAQSAAGALYGDRAFEDIAEIKDLDMPEAREVFLDLQLGDADAATYARLANAEPADDAMRQAWRDEAETRLKEAHIPQADLDRARRYIARDPRIAAHLEETGLGNHVDVVLRVIELAKSAAARGERF